MSYAPSLKTSKMIERGYPSGTAVIPFRNMQINPALRHYLKGFGPASLNKT